MQWLRTPEELREGRRECYQLVRQNTKPGSNHPYTIDSWEQDGYGYAVLRYPDGRQQPWGVVRDDLVDYYGVVYQFYTHEEMDARIEREGWRGVPEPQLVQMVLPI